MNSLIYGKNPHERIVSIEPGESTTEMFFENVDGTVTSETVPCTHYILFDQERSPKMKRLSGNQYYNHIMEYDSRSKYEEVLSASYKKKYPLHVIRDPKEAFMCKEGFTYFKGMKVEDVSVLSVDTETTGLLVDKNGRILLIPNTFRRKGVITRRLFCVDDYADDSAMIDAWCDWVREMNPSVITGHNLFGFDLPYLHKRSRSGLKLGRDGSTVKFNHRTSQFRKDGSQSYDYVNALIYGREVVDMWFVSMKYDVAARREYESYKLKDIIKHEGLERKGRVLVDASQIRHYYANRHTNPKPWEDTKKYAVDDADDALKLYDLMIPSFFYYTQSIPRSLQSIINTASGSHVNSWMVRSYLQQGHSIALGSEKESYEGAISFGVAGIHRNVFKIDVRSLYPSIIIAHKIYNREKDPQANFLKFTEFFTQQRIKDALEFERTGDIKFEKMSASRKININSAYGFLGAPKLNYNSPADAAKVTEIGRKILKQAIVWASGKEYVPELDETGEQDAAS